MAKKMKVNEGDWICADKDCGNVNFSWREKCNKCGKDKGKVDTYKKTGSEIGKQAASKSGGLFSADDWQCAMCGNVNWARRNECNMCKQPKFAKVEARTGVGGGYCERDNVEYIDRGDSDDEIDEFGRKKKQFRLNRNGSTSNKTESDEEIAGREEEDDDDDEDDDVDLSKYDLAASDEETASTDNRKDVKSSRSHDWSKRRSRSRSRDRKSRRSRSRSRDRHRSRSGERRRRHDSDRRERRSRSPERRRRSYRSRS